MQGLMFSPAVVGLTGQTSLAGWLAKAAFRPGKMKQTQGSVACVCCVGMCVFALVYRVDIMSDVSYHTRILS